MPYGCWQDVHTYLENTRELINKKFHAARPFVNMETGQIADYRLHPQNTNVFTLELRKEHFDKTDFIRKLTEDNIFRSFVRLSVNAGGLRPYLTDMPAYRERKSYLTVKRYLEMFRYHQDITDGVSLNTLPTDVIRRIYDKNNVLPGANVEPWPEGPAGLAIAEPVYSFRMAFYPVQLLMRIDNPHLLSGTDTPAPIHIVNDSEKDATVDLRVQLRDPQGRAAELLTRKGIAIPQGRMVELPFKLSAPANAASGKHVVETYLFAGDRKIAENSYDIFILAARDRITTYSARKVALYDAVPTRFAGLGMKSTSDILKTLKIPFQPIRGFDHLADYDVLIIGANSLDGTVFESGKTLNQWLKNGGRLLMFEQCVAGSLPWVNDERIMLLAKSSFVEHFHKKHPIFNGIEDEMIWESPAGQQGGLFETCLELNDGFLSLAAVGDNRDPGGVRSVINDRRIGDGEYLISMISTTDRFGKDATITRYVGNMLSYILSDAISPYAAATKNTDVPVTHTVGIEAKDVVYIDIKSAVNRGFADEVEGDKQGGWTDYGASHDLRNIPTGRSSLGGGVPFDIIDPAGNQGKSCIVLAGPTRDYFPRESSEIAVDKKLDKLFFLHTLLWVKAGKGDVVLEYEVKYRNGETETIAMKNHIDLADWWMGRDCPNGRVVYRDGDKGVYLSEWVNPKPNLEIASIKAITQGNAIPVVIAVSGKSRFAQRIDRVDVEDNRE
ncbi:MAG: hypothetical protein WC058_13755 [Phycisphaeraceae bacterium]